MTTITANEESWNSKMKENYLLEEVNYHSGVIGGANNGLHPLGDIVNDDQDILITQGRWERSHEIYPLYVKDFDFKNVVQGHFISP